VKNKLLHATELHISIYSNTNIFTLSPHKAGLKILPW